MKLLFYLSVILAADYQLDWFMGDYKLLSDNDDCDIIGPSWVDDRLTLTPNITFILKEGRMDSADKTESCKYSYDTKITNKKGLFKVRTNTIRTQCEYGGDGIISETMEASQSGENVKIKYTGQYLPLNKKEKEKAVECEYLKES
jgi:hypothetical protein